MGNLWLLVLHRCLRVTTPLVSCKENGLRSLSPIVWGRCWWILSLSKPLSWIVLTVIALIHKTESQVIHTSIDQPLLHHTLQLTASTSLIILDSTMSSSPPHSPHPHSAATEGRQLNQAFSSYFHHQHGNPSNAPEQSDAPVSTAAPVSSSNTTIFIEKPRKALTAYSAYNSCFIRLVFSFCHLTL